MHFYFLYDVYIIWRDLRVFFHSGCNGTNILFQLNKNWKLSYSKTDIDFSSVNSLLNATVYVLERLRDSKDGTDVLSSSPSLDPSGLCTFEFKGHTIRDSSKQRDEAVSVCKKFVSAVIVNLRDRFVSKGDGQVMSAMCSLFDPSLIASSVSPSIRKL